MYEKTPIANDSTTNLSIEVRQGQVLPSEIQTKEINPTKQMPYLFKSLRRLAILPLIVLATSCDATTEYHPQQQIEIVPASPYEPTPTISPFSLPTIPPKLYK